MDVKSRRWAALWVIALAQFMVIMDTSIIGVALPKMRADLGFSPAGSAVGVQRICGRLRRVVASRRPAVGPVRGTAAVRDRLGRVVGRLGGVRARHVGRRRARRAGRARRGSALIAPAALTLLMTLFGGTPDLPKAIALYGAAAPAGGTAGVFLGGVITQWLSWPWIFWLYVPISLAALLATPLLMPRAPVAADRSTCWAHSPSPRAWLSPCSAWSAHPWSAGPPARPCYPHRRRRPDRRVLSHRGEPADATGATGHLPDPVARQRQPGPTPAGRRVGADVVLPQPLLAAGPRLRRVRLRGGVAAHDRPDHGADGRVAPRLIARFGRSR